MEEVLAPIGRFIISLARTILLEMIINGVVYGLGFSVLKLVSLGSYPSNPLSQKMKNHCLLAGIVTVIIAIFTIGVFNGLN